MKDDPQSNGEPESGGARWERYEGPSGSSPYDVTFRVNAEQADALTRFFDECFTELAMEVIEIDPTGKVTRRVRRW